MIFLTLIITGLSVVLITCVWYWLAIRKINKDFEDYKKKPKFIIGFKFSNGCKAKFWSIWGGVYKFETYIDKNEVCVSITYYVGDSRTEINRALLDYCYQKYGDFVGEIAENE